MFEYDFRYDTKVGSLWYCDFEKQEEVLPTLIVYESTDKNNYKYWIADSRSFVMKVSNETYFIGDFPCYKILTLDHEGNQVIGWINNPTILSLLKKKL